MRPSAASVLDLKLLVSACLPAVRPSGQCALMTPSLETGSQLPYLPALASSKKSMSSYLYALRRLVSERYRFS